MGIVFGRYELLRRIAAGGMGEVYLARQAGLEGFEKFIVVKVLLPHLVENENFTKMFLDEARIAARLNHANIAQIFDLGEIDGAYYIAMEYIHGEDVKRIWKTSVQKKKPIPLHLAVRIAADTAAGLDYAHKATDSSNNPLGIVHRDVSPQNILVTFDGCVKIIDFGIAKATGRSINTATGTLKGKFPYMSPEQVRAKPLDHRSDIFALGIVLYEMVTGRRLFARETDIATLRAVDDCNVPLPSGLNPKIDSALDSVLLKALSQNPEDRFRDAGAFRLALEEWMILSRKAGSSAHLGAYLQDLYAERLLAEKQKGAPLTESDKTPSKIPGRPSGAAVPDALASEKEKPDSDPGNIPDNISGNIPGKSISGGEISPPDKDTDYVKNDGQSGNNGHERGISSGAAAGSSVEDSSHRLNRNESGEISGSLDDIDISVQSVQSKSSFSGPTAIKPGPSTDGKSDESRGEPPAPDSVIRPDSSTAGIFNRTFYIIAAILLITGALTAILLIKSPFTPDEAAHDIRLIADATDIREPPVSDLKKTALNGEEKSGFEKRDPDGEEDYAESDSEIASAKSGEIIDEKIDEQKADYDPEDKDAPREDPLAEKSKEIDSADEIIADDTGREVIADTINLLITSTPNRAAVILDGKVIGRTPVNHELTRSDEVQRIRLRLPGHRQATRTVRPDKNRKLHFNLEALPPPEKKEIKESLDIKTGR